MQPSLRRKLAPALFSAASFATKPPYSARKSGSLSTLGLVVFSIFMFSCFMYNHDRHAEFPLSISTKNHKEIHHSSIGIIADDQAKIASVGMNSRTEVETGVAEIKNVEEEEEEAEEEDMEIAAEECDLFTGNWVLDNVSRPLYKEEECGFLTEQVRCMRNGRKSSLYQKWRWQPRDCNLPKFEGRLMVEKLRNKRMMFVGDSLNRNQWESMICLVQSSISCGGNMSLEKKGSLSVFTIQDYNASVEFYWAPFLVESNSDDPNMHAILNRIISPQSITKHANNWRNVHFLIFNTYIWWMNTPTIKVSQGLFEEGSSEHDEVERPKAYEQVLTTWAKWVDENVDPNQTKVFFMSMSPLHIKSLDWNEPDGIKCAKETSPILNTTQPVNVGTDKRLLMIASNVTNSMKVPVHFLNITMLSEYRKDAHTSVYTVRQGQLLSAKQQADPATYADCIHWCLPGLPDTWNELLYARIISHSTSR